MQKQKNAGLSSCSGRENPAVPPSLSFRIERPLSLTRRKRQLLLYSSEPLLPDYLPCCFWLSFTNRKLSACPASRYSFCSLHLISSVNISIGNTSRNPQSYTNLLSIFVGFRMLSIRSHLKRTAIQKGEAVRLRTNILADRTRTRWKNEPRRSLKYRKG